MEQTTKKKRKISTINMKTSRVGEKDEPEEER